MVEAGVAAVGAVGEYGVAVVVVGVVGGSANAEAAVVSGSSPGWKNQ